MPIINDRLQLLNSLHSVYKDIDDSNLLKMLNVFLEMIGKSFKADRSYMFMNHVDVDSELKFSQILEWCNEGVEPQPHLLCIPYSEQQFLFDILDKGQLWFMDEVKGMPILEAQGIKSILIAPIFCDREFWGYYGMDMCKHKYKWTQVDFLTCKAVSCFLNKVVTKNREDSYLSSIKLEIDEFSSELEKEMRDWLENWETRDVERSNSNANRHRSA